MAIQALLVILAVLLVLLFLGVPISYAIAVSSLTAILSSIDLNVLSGILCGRGRPGTADQRRAQWIDTL